jgi:hypothetical protein
MAIDAIWAWTFRVVANALPVTGSLEVHIPTQAFVYISDGLQYFRHFQERPPGGEYPGVAIEAQPLIDSYTVNGVPRTAISDVVFDNDVDSVLFSFFVLPNVPADPPPLPPPTGGSSELEVHFLFQIFGGS